MQAFSEKEMERVMYMYFVYYMYGQYYWDISKFKKETYKGIKRVMCILQASLTVI